MKISVIIPVYNSEKTLDKTISSVISQSLSEIEIICVNDGSTDNSLSILNKYAQLDKRIKIITQENQGVSVARNTGITQATGEFIMFLDADDLYLSNTCEIAYNSVTKNHSDIGIFSHIRKSYYHIPFLNLKISKKKLYSTEKSHNLWRFQTFCWDKIYNTEFLKHNNLLFPKGVKTAEDGIFSLCCLFNNPKYTFIKQPLIIYNMGEVNSATSNTLAIKNDLFALKTLVNMPIFQKQNNSDKIKVIEKFCSGSWSYYKRFKNKTDNTSLKKEINEFLGYIEENFDKSELKTLKKYNQLKSIK